MADHRSETKKSVRIQTNEKPQQTSTASAVERPVGMPNPVKGLKLSLYPMTKQH